MSNMGQNIRYIKVIPILVRNYVEVGFALRNDRVVRGLNLKAVLGVGICDSGKDCDAMILVVELWFHILHDIDIEVRTPRYRVGGYSCDHAVVPHENRSNSIEHITRIWQCCVEKGGVSLLVILTQGRTASIVDGGNPYKECDEGTELVLKVRIVRSIGRYARTV